MATLLAVPGMGGSNQNEMPNMVTYLGAAPQNLLEQVPTERVVVFQMYSRL
jgi:hypothetical protein